MGGLPWDMAEIKKKERAPVPAGNKENTPAVIKSDSMDTDQTETRES